MDKRVQKFFLMADRLAANRTMRGIFEVMWQFPDHYVSLFLDAQSRVHRISYTTYRNQIISAAARFSGILPKENRGCFIGFKLKNCHEWGVLFWALLMAGYKPVLIDAKATQERTEYLLSQAGAFALVADDEHSYSVPVVPSKQPLTGGAVRFYEPSWENQVAFCTSGTTDTPHIYVFDGEAMSYQIESARMMPQETNDIMYPDSCGQVRILAFLPFHHIFGFVAVFYGIRFLAGPLYTYPKWRRAPSFPPAGSCA